MPTFDRAPRFFRDWKALSGDQHALARRMIRQFIEDLTQIEQGHSQGFRHQLRVKQVRGTDSVWEMSWDYDGRATFEYGESSIEGKMHVIWRRIGTHDVFGRP